MVGTYIVITLLTTLLALFSTAVMSYIAMATPIGPWVAPMLVLIASLLLKSIFYWVRDKNQAIALSTAGGSIGGILATACGFSFPTLYFLDPTLFGQWMADPALFIGAMALLSIAAGGLGFIIANTLEHKFIVEQDMSFPVGQLVYKMIAAQNQAKKAWELVAGFLATVLFCVLQGGIRGMKAVVPRSLTLLRSQSVGFFQIPALSLDLNVLPMLLAIGFIAGHMIAIPLLAGALSKYCLVDPLHTWLFPHLKNWDFVLAFVSGMVLIGAVFSFLKAPELIWGAIKKLRVTKDSNVWQELRKTVSVLELACLVGALITFFIYFKFSLLASLYLTLFTYVCTYQVTLIAGKIGLAQLGRFATFVMVPALFLFGTDPIQVTLIATFVEICAGVATDVLFGRKMAHLAHIPQHKIKNIQLYGLIIASCAIGIVFWLLINHFGLGTQDLFAQRAQSRALLIAVRGFNVYALALGALYGYILMLMKLNPMLVLGGLIMPLNYSLGLILGGLVSFFVKSREEWEPFWSGVFAANSMWELLKTIF